MDFLVIGKGDRQLLPERPFGCCAQKVPVPFSQLPLEPPSAMIAHFSVGLSGCSTYIGCKTLADSIFLFENQAFSGMIPLTKWGLAPGDR